MSDPKVVAEDAAKPVHQEYSSVTISLDHLMNADRTDGHVVTKMVFSTESAFESLMSQLTYFKLASILHDHKQMTKAHHLGREAGVAVLEAREGLTNVIVDMAVFDQAMDNDDLGGSVMETVQSFVILASDLRRDATKRGDLSPLQVFISNN